MTIQFCIELCRGADLPIAAILVFDRLIDMTRSYLNNFFQSDICFCLPDVTVITFVPNAYCNQTCIGNPRQMCGGDEAFVSVFNVGKYLGPTYV